MRPKSRYLNFTIDPETRGQCLDEVHRVVTGFEGFNLRELIGHARTTQYRIRFRWNGDFDALKETVAAVSGVSDVSVSDPFGSD